MQQHLILHSSETTLPHRKTVHVQVPSPQYRGPGGDVMAQGLSQQASLQHYVWDHKEYVILFCIAAATAYAFVYHGFATGDGLRYAVEIRRIVDAGLLSMRLAFNAEMSFAYFLLLFALLKVLGAGIALSVIMNGLNAVTSVILQLLLYKFFLDLTSSRRLALFAVLTVLLAPAIWLYSHAAHAVLISATLLIAALSVLDRIVVAKEQSHARLSRWGLFILLVALIPAFRLDNVLGFGAFFGLLYFRGMFTMRTAGKTLGALCVAGVIYLGMRYAAMGSLYDPSGGTVAHHLTTRIVVGQVPANILKNLVLWAIAVNALVLVLAFFGLLREGVRGRLSVLLLSWTIPWCIFLPFRGMDTARLILPTIPIIALVAVHLVTSVFRKQQMFVLMIFLVASQLVSVGLYYPLTKSYPFRNRIEGRPLAAVPIGSLVIDHQYTQKAITIREETAGRVAHEKDHDVLVVGDGDGLMYYTLALYEQRHVVSWRRDTCDTHAFITYVTPQNVFRLYDRGESPREGDPVHSLPGCIDPARTLVHVTPLLEDSPPDPEVLYHDATPH